MKNYLKRWAGRARSQLLLLLLILTSFSLVSAQVTVTGTVTSADDGMPIPGVNIVEKGTAHGTITDANGTYSLEVPADASLMFSFIGMETMEVEVADRC